ncbi:MAG: amidohydrolase family protein [Deltaproteobacteria bacterium]|nr:amidohydrolase family protein [Deltaproteobacteria bacterium]
MNHRKILIKNAEKIITMDYAGGILSGDILISNGRIEETGGNVTPTGDEYLIDAAGRWVMPGFIQCHIHLCQTGFRNSANDLPLVRWLDEKILPMEAALDGESTRLNSLLGIAELLKCGTTTIMDMGAVRHTDVIIETAIETGIRGFFGKTIMDAGVSPDSLREETDFAINDAVRLFEKFDGAANGRIRCTFNPRFAPACSGALFERLGKIAGETGAFVHTHAHETTEEIELTVRYFGMRGYRLFEKYGLAGENLFTAHAVWLDEEDLGILKCAGVNVVHCPSGNMALASGVAPVKRLLDEGVTVLIGADGAPCNNNLNVFSELRHAAFLIKLTSGAGGVDCRKLVSMATIEAAKALKIDRETGSVEAGKKADLIILNPYLVHSMPCPEPFSSIVYSFTDRNAEAVLVDGEILYQNGRLTTIDENELLP